MKSIHNLGDATELEDLPKEYQSHIVSTRVRVGRTVKGYPMAGKLTREQRVDLENRIKESLAKNKSHLKNFQILTRHIIQNSLWRIPLTVKLEEKILTAAKEGK